MTIECVSLHMALSEDLGAIYESDQLHRPETRRTWARHDRDDQVTSNQWEWDPPNTFFCQARPAIHALHLIEVNHWRAPGLFSMWIDRPNAH
jgi:hypothetical protein